MVAVVLFIVSACSLGTQVKMQPSNLQKIKKEAATVDATLTRTNSGMVASAGALKGDASTINSEASIIGTIVPNDVLPLVGPHITVIKSAADDVSGQADAITKMAADIAGLKTTVGTMQGELTTEIQRSATLEGQLKDEHAARVAAEKKNESQNFWLTCICIGCIGVSVAAGFLCKDFSISIAGVAGGVSMLVAVQMTGTLGAVATVLSWVLGAVVFIFVVWFIVDAVRQGSFSAALKNGPIQDIENLWEEVTHHAAGTASAVATAAVLTAQKIASPVSVTVEPGIASPKTA